MFLFCFALRVIATLLKLCFTFISPLKLLFGLIYVTLWVCSLLLFLLSLLAFTVSTKNAPEFRLFNWYWFDFILPSFVAVVNVCPSNNVQMCKVRCFYTRLTCLVPSTTGNKQPKWRHKKYSLEHVNFWKVFFSFEPGSSCGLFGKTKNDKSKVKRKQTMFMNKIKSITNKLIILIFISILRPYWSSW